MLVLTLFFEYKIPLFIVTLLTIKSLVRRPLRDNQCAGLLTFRIVCLIVNSSYGFFLPTLGVWPHLCTKLIKNWDFPWNIFSEWIQLSKFNFLIDLMHKWNHTLGVCKNFPSSWSCICQISHKRTRLFPFSRRGSLSYKLHLPNIHYLGPNQGHI